MFTGIIETTGIIKEIKQEGTNVRLLINSNISKELKADQSISHNGVCLTVTHADAKGYWVTAIQETLKKSNLGNLKVDDLVNLERAMPMNGRFEGHIVQGHVDAVALCKSVVDKKGSWLFEFEHQSDAPLVEKGSIAVNGVSLTCFDVTKKRFTVAIIPYTFDHTTFKTLKPGQTVNLEFDIIGKYVGRMLNVKF